MNIGKNIYQGKNELSHKIEVDSAINVNNNMLNVIKHSIDKHIDKAEGLSFIFTDLTNQLGGKWSITKFNANLVEGFTITHHAKSSVILIVDDNIKLVIALKGK
uniref:Type VII secretion protein n=1 Tax=Parastrongyloides trichosuri TaxID=131310 RepID=A0A0N4Z396_PARTI